MYPLCGLPGLFCCGGLTTVGGLVGLAAPSLVVCQALPCLEAVNAA